MNREEIIRYFEEKEFLNSIGHAYLFSNANYENIKGTIEYILSSIIFKNDLKFEDNPDIYLIEPEKDVIKKEKILDLEEKLSKTSQIGYNKVYIIKECEKLNASAANCLLKTLEEPSENVYAFLITSNINSVISTIKSRCQIIQCETAEEIIDDEEILKKAIELVKLFELKSVRSVVYKADDLYKNIDKEELKRILKNLELFYKDCLNKLYGMKIEIYKNEEELISKVIEKNDYKKIVNKIKILNDNIDLLKYNLNGNLFIDKFLIEIGRL